jgi:NDP-sugar pyrophosphorylase family protein
MEAVILAGGKGSRLLPHTAEIPKPLVPVGDHPIIEILLSQLKKAGVRKVYMAVNHLAPLIESLLGDGSNYGLEIHYSSEDKPLSTVGPLKLISNLPEQFIVANGDVLSDLNVKLLYDYHCRHEAALTVATYQRRERIDYGVLQTAPDNTVTGFSEKPSYDFVVSMGIYVFWHSVLKEVPPGEPFGFDQLMLKLLAAGQKVMSYPYDGYWLDIGRPEDYARAQADIVKIKSLLP